jgi:hypothetical protein
MSPEVIAYTNAPQIMGIASSFYAIALFIVLLRCYVRVAMLRVFGVDDWIMVFAMVGLFSRSTLEPNANMRSSSLRLESSFASRSNAITV